MDQDTDKFLHTIDHLWPILSGIVLTVLASIKLWWHDRRDTKSRIRVLETMAEHMVSQKDLQTCKDEVREKDDEQLEKVYREIKEYARQNAEQHHDIMQQIIRLHEGDK